MDFIYIYLKFLLLFKAKIICLIIYKINKSNLLKKILLNNNLKYLIILFIYLIIFMNINNFI